MSKPNATGLKRLIAACGYSWKGFVAAWRFEEAFRQEVALAVIFVPLSFWLANTPIELILLITSILWILMAELVNSAIEAVVDRVGLEKHELSGRAKDIGSALVMLSVFVFVFVWGVIGYHNLILNV